MQSTKTTTHTSHKAQNAEANEFAHPLITQAGKGTQSTIENNTSAGINSLNSYKQMQKPLKFSTRPKRKIDNEFCPCGKSNDDNKFCSFAGFEGQGKGHCHSCNKTFFPDKSENVSYIFAPHELPKVRPEPSKISAYFSDYSSALHSFMQGFAGEDLSEHFEKYLIGTNSQKTVFGYANGIGDIISLKFFAYQTNGKRDRATNPHYTKNCERCLYGLHLYDKAKPAIIVESEKTAQALGLYFDSAYNFLATGGANGSRKEHLLPLIGNEVYYFADNDKAGNENKVIYYLLELHNESQIQLKILAPFTGKPEKYDLADYLFEYRQDQTAESLRQWISSTPFAPIPKPSYKNDNLTTNQEASAVMPTQTTTSQDQTTHEPATEPSQTQGNSETPTITKIKNYLSYRYIFRRNILSNEIEFSTKQNPHKVEPINTDNFFCELLELGFKVGKNIVDSLLNSSFVPKYNPITNYFESLASWKPETDKDHITQLANFVTFDKPKERTRFALHLKKHLVRMIAQVYKKSYYNKQCLVLVGEKQDTGKTSFLEFLCPPALQDYKRKDLPQYEVKHKDNRFALAQNFQINLDELKSYKQDQTNAVKALFSLETVNDRMHHEKNNTRLQRFASFVASTNNSDFLTDETGSVRWLCFGNVTKIDFSYRQKIDINHIWAQAFHLFNSGYEYEVSAEEKAESEKINLENYSEETTESELLIRHFQPDTKKDKANFKQNNEILTELEAKSKRNNLSSKKLGQALKKYNFPKGSQRHKTTNTPLNGYFVLPNYQENFE